MKSDGKSAGAWGHLHGAASAAAAAAAVAFLLLVWASRAVLQVAASVLRLLLEPQTPWQGVSATAAWLALLVARVDLWDRSSGWIRSEFRL